MTTVAMHNLWNYIQGLNLSARNQTWLANQLMAEKEKKQKKKAEDPTLMTKEEFFARIEEASKGEGKSFSSVKALDQYLRSL